jgi:type I restriction enzyme S subunit
MVTPRTARVTETDYPAAEACVPKGYKQTEIGVIPEDWRIEFVENLAHITTGSKNTQDRVDDGQYPFFVRSQKVERINSYSFDGEAVLTAGDGVGTGKVFHYINGKFDVHQRVYRLSDFNAQINGYFFYLYFSNHFYGRIMQMTAKSSVDSVRREMIAKMLIPLPPTKAEQEAIAGALSEADALTESLEQLIAKKRLPGFSGTWEERTLFDLAERKKEHFDDGDWIESEHITDEGIRLIQTGNIGVGVFVEKDDKKYIFEKSFVSLHCKEIRQGDLLICRLAEPAGRSCVLPDIGEGKIVTSVDVTIFRPPPSAADRVFLANIFSTDQWFRSVSDRSGGTTHKRISRGALGRLKIKVPTVKEQTAIASILSDMDAEIAALEEKLAKARMIKQGMMQELLTGRIRLI